MVVAIVVIVLLIKFIITINIVDWWRISIHIGHHILAKKTPIHNSFFSQQIVLVAPQLSLSIEIQCFSPFSIHLTPYGLWLQHHEKSLDPYDYLLGCIKGCSQCPKSPLWPPL